MVHCSLLLGLVFFLLLVTGLLKAAEVVEEHLEAIDGSTGGENFWAEQIGV